MMIKRLLCTTLLSLPILVCMGAGELSLHPNNETPISPLNFLQLQREVAELGDFYTLDGVVTFVSSINTNKFVIASAEGLRRQGVVVFANGGAAIPEVGDYVVVRGQSAWRDTFPMLLANRINTLREESLPAAPGVKQSDFRKGLLYGRRVLLSGEVRDVRVEDSPSGPVNIMMVYLETYSACVKVPGELDFDKYRGESVDITGIVWGKYNEDGDFLASELEVAGAEDIKIVKTDGRSRAIAVAGLVFGIALLIVSCILLVLWLRKAREVRESAMIAAERRRMAADLHDTIEQHLAGANLLAAGVLALDDVPEDVADAMRSLSGLLANAKAEVRDAIMNLRGEVNGRITLAEAIAQTCRGLSKTGINTRRMLRGLPEYLPEGVLQDIILIVREATTNAVKHGHARTVIFAADPAKDGGAILRIANDGAGFDPERALGPETGHFGLSGMRERAIRNGFSIEWLRDGRWMIVELSIKMKEGWK